jgi:hypothetical protein
MVLDSHLGYDRRRTDDFCPLFFDDTAHTDKDLWCHLHALKQPGVNKGAALAWTNCIAYFDIVEFHPIWQNATCPKILIPSGPWWQAFL